MIVLEQGAILERLWSLILVSVRMSGMLVVAPFFAASSISTPIRVALSISMALILSSVISIPEVDMFSVSAVILLLREGLIGLMIGLIYQLAFASIAMAGEQIAFSMGLGFASMIDPQTGAQSPVITQFLSILLILVFLSIEGHHVLLQQVIASYRALPIELKLDSGIYLDLARSAGLVFSVALLFAMPIIVALLCTNLLIGLLTRVAPQMNIFAVGFPITIFIGLALLLVLVPNMSVALAGLIETAAGITRKLILGEA